MSVLLRCSPLASSFARGLCLAAAGAAMALGGCSASITRFDNPSFSLGGDGAGGTTTRRTAGGSVLDAPASAAEAPATPPRSRGTEVASLPVIDTQQSGAQVPPLRAMAVTKSPPPVHAASAPAPVQTAAVARGQQIEVQPGDTLYGLSRKHNVLIVDLMAANELKSPNLKPGQKLYLPATSGVRATPQVKPERVAAARPVPPTAAPAMTAAPEVAAAPAAESGATYTVRPGDSLYAIAAKHKVKLLDLQRVNNITDVRKVKPGMVLQLPVAGHGGTVAQPAQHSPGETMQPEARIARVAGPGSAAPHGVKLINGSEPQPESVTPIAASPAETAMPAAQPGKLRWPARGRIVQTFGARADGTQNDGIDIAVPAGTDVLAAEGGVVSYAGSEVKTYGNLVLIRHDNGWVTAYAYNDKILVQRGDRVKRGQAIAKAGKTGTADQPLVHFEVRVGSKPVDPVGYLEKL